MKRRSLQSPVALAVPTSSSAIHAARPGRPITLRNSQDKPRIP